MGIAQFHKLQRKEARRTIGADGVALLSEHDQGLAHHTAVLNAQASRLATLEEGLMRVEGTAVPIAWTFRQRWRWLLWGHV